MTTLWWSGHALCKVPNSAEFVLVSAVICPSSGQYLNFTSGTTSSECHNASNFFVNIPDPHTVEMFLVEVNHLNNITRIYCDYNPIFGILPTSETFGPQTAVIYIQGMIIITFVI